LARTQKTDAPVALQSDLLHSGKRFLMQRPCYRPAAIRLQPGGLLKTASNGQTDRFHIIAGFLSWA
jgi:hypothetical protein